MTTSRRNCLGECLTRAPPLDVASHERGCEGCSEYRNRQRLPRASGTILSRLLADNLRYPYSPVSRPLATGIVCRSEGSSQREDIGPPFRTPRVYPTLHVPVKRAAALFGQGRV